MAKVIAEVVCDRDAPNPDGKEGSVGFARRFSLALGYTFEEVPHGVIVTKQRSVLIPWSNILGCPLTEGESGRATKDTTGPAGRANKESKQTGITAA